MLTGWFQKTSDPILKKGDLLLRPATARDYGEWRALRAGSHGFLKPYEPRWGEAELKQAVFNERLYRARAERQKGTEFSFLIVKTGGGPSRIVGGVTLSNIRRRVAMQAHLGYWMGVDYAGQGIMSSAVSAVLPFVFNELGLNRLNAACLPDNAASRSVLEKNGFKEEGYAESYLKIDGDWRDHVLYGLTRARYDSLPLHL